MIAVLIKTYMREKRLYNCVKSVREYLNCPYRLYIADDGPISSSKKNFYNHLTAQGHNILLLDEYTPVTRARNMLVDLLDNEAYILRLDDDFEITQETHVKKMLTVLQKNPHLGAISDLERQIGDGKSVLSGEISPRQGILKQDGETLLKVNKAVDDWEYQRVSGIRFTECDFCRNFLLIRRKVFESVRWEEALVIAGEHIDFMLTLKSHGWGLAFTPDSIHYHREDIEVEQEDVYRIKRTAVTDYQDVFHHKWGIKQIEDVYTNQSQADNQPPPPKRWWQRLKDVS